VYSDGDDPKHGISQTDLYQMITYAIRFGVDEIKLFYPNTLLTTQLASGELIIHDTLAGNQRIRITTHQLPIIHNTLFKESLQTDASLGAIFEITRMELKRSLELVLKVL
jgi:5-methylcytosine-specific restriction enzyme subunit McrC